MAIRKVYEKIEPITKKLCSEVSEARASTGECIFDEKHMHHLLNLFKTGPFHAPTWVIVFCKQDGQYYRADGKHSSAIFHLGLLPMADRQARVIRYECDRSTEVADIFNMFDQPESARPTTEINQSVAAHIKDIANLSKQFIDDCVAGIQLSLQGTENYDRTHKPSKLEKAKRLEDEKKFVVFIDSIHNTPNVKASIKHMQKVPVFAVAHSIYHENEAFAREFLTLVRDGSNPNTGEHPDRTLYEYLRTCRIPDKNKEIASAKDILKKSFKCWEQFVAMKNGNAVSHARPRFKKRGKMRKLVAA